MKGSIQPILAQPFPLREPVRGLLEGTVVGAIPGALIGALAARGLGDKTSDGPAGIILFAVIGAVFLGWVGAFIGCMVRSVGAAIRGNKQNKGNAH